MRNIKPSYLKRLMLFIKKNNKQNKAETQKLFISNVCGDLSGILNCNTAAPHGADKSHNFWADESHSIPRLKQFLVHSHF